MTDKDKDTKDQADKAARDQADKTAQADKPPATRPADGPLDKPHGEQRGGKEGEAAERPRRSRLNNPPAFDLLQAIEAATLVEIGFCDGDNPIEGMSNIEIPGGIEGWRQLSTGLALNVPELLVYGPGPSGTPVYSIACYSLFCDGVEVAWSERDRPLAIEPGMTFDLKDDMLF